MRENIFPGRNGKYYPAPKTREEIIKRNKYLGKIITDYNHGSFAFYMFCRKNGIYEDAREELVVINKGLVGDLVKKYKNRGVSLQELLSAGEEGLYRATEDFDARTGNQFSTYAGHCIKSYIRAEIANQKSRIMHIPMHVAEKVDYYARVVSMLKQELKREPSDAEVINYLEKEKKSENASETLKKSSPKLIVKAGKIAKSPVKKVDTGFIEDYREQKSLESITREEQRDIKSTLVRSLLNDSNLTPKERMVIECRYGLNGHSRQTLKEVGEKIGVTRERTRQIESNALKKLRNYAQVENKPLLLKNEKERLKTRLDQIEIEKAKEMLQDEELTQKEKKILRMYFGLSGIPLTIEQIADEMKLERLWVTLHLKRIKEKLKKAS